MNEGYETHEWVYNRRVTDVIVVIGILAAITIVAYNGIQNRANYTKMVNTIAQYAKALTLYASEKSTYPGVVASVVEPNNAACLDGTTNCLPAGSNATKSAIIKTELGSYIGSFPSALNSAITYATITPEAGGSYTGYYIIFEVRATTCPSVGGLTYLNRSSSPNGSYCRMALPNPS